MFSRLSPSLRLVVALALTVAIDPLSLGSYLPAFPAMARSLEVSVSDISLSVSVYIFTMALGQLVGGPLSDQFGRRRIIVSGLVLYSLASLLIWQSTALEALLFFRALQAFGAGWVMVSVLALVRDHARGVESARLFNLIGLIMLLVHGLAPTLGGALLAMGGWPMIFMALGLYALLLLPILDRAVFTRPPSDTGTRPAVMTPFKRYAGILTRREAWPFLFWQAASFSLMMIFMTQASFLYQQHFGVSSQKFSLLFGANVAAKLVAKLINRTLLGHLGARRVLGMATCLQALGLAGLMVATQLHAGLTLFVPAMMLVIGMVGAMAPNLQAVFLEHFETSSASAAAVLGALQFSVAGLASAISSRLPTSVTSVVLAMAACSLVSLAMMMLSRRQQRTGRALTATKV